MESLDSVTLKQTNPLRPMDSHGPSDSPYRQDSQKMCNYFGDCFGNLQTTGTATPFRLSTISSARSRMKAFPWLLVFWLVKGLSQ